MALTIFSLGRKCRKEASGDLPDARKSATIDSDASLSKTTVKKISVPRYVPWIGILASLVILIMTALVAPVISSAEIERGHAEELAKHSSHQTPEQRAKLEERGRLIVLLTRQREADAVLLLRISLLAITCTLVSFFIRKPQIK